MEIIKIKNDKIAAGDLYKALDALMAGEVIMHATETCYGLAVDIFQVEALARLYALKGRDFDKGPKPVSMMVCDLEQAGKYAEFNSVALKLAEKFWPGPLTLILPRKNSLPDFFNPGVRTVGLRCPDHKVAQALIKAYGGPLSTTSANVSTLPEVYKVEDYLAQLKGLKMVDLEPGVVLDQGLIAKNSPSTLVGFEEDGSAKIMREGALVKEIKTFLRTTLSDK